MARATAKRKVTRKPRKKRRSSSSRINLKSLIYKLIIFIFFIFSIGMLTYVIFFRMVVAAELTPSIDNPILYEEPGSLGVTTWLETSEEESNTLPKVAIIIDDMGFHQEIGESLIRLPLNLSFSFLPYAPFTKKQEDMAYKLGKTVMLHLPLQPTDKNWDPGQGALYIDELGLQNTIFQENVNMVPHATGVNNHMGSLYTANSKGMESLLNLVADKKLFFIDSYTTADSLGYTLAQKKGIRSARRDLFLDNIQDKKEICKQLQNLFDIAEKRGRAIGIAHPYQETLSAFEVCLENSQQNAQLVSVESLIN